MAKTLKQLRAVKAAEDKKRRQRLKDLGYVPYRRDILPEWKAILDEMIVKLKVKIKE